MPDYNMDPRFRLESWHRLTIPPLLQRGPHDVVDILDERVPKLSS
jgi:hypothetical protein